MTRTRAGATLYRWSAPSYQRGTVTLDDGEWTRCYVPATHAISTNRSSPQPRGKHDVERIARLVGRNYSVRISGEEQLAGRPCYLITMIPRSEIAHAIKLWVDKANFFILGRQENNSHGHTIALTLYRWIEFPDGISAASLKKAFPPSVRVVKSTPARVFSNISELRKRVGADICIPFSMPAGFEFERCELIDTEGTKTLCFRFTDGWSSISIYQTPTEERRPVSQREMHYARHPLGDCVIDYETHSMNFMLIGRVEMTGLLCITNALDPDRERGFMENTSRFFRVEPTMLMLMRNAGLGLDTINGLLEVSARTRAPIPSLISLSRDGYSWSDIALRFHVDPRLLLSRVRTFQCR